MSNFHKYLQVQDEDAPSLHFQHGSYFFMAPDSGRDILLENFQLQRFAYLRNLIKNNDAFEDQWV